MGKKYNRLILVQLYFLFVRHYKYNIVRVYWYKSSYISQTIFTQQYILYVRRVIGDLLMTLSLFIGNL